MLAFDPNSTPVTIEEYMLRKERSEVRHECYDGHVYAMAGGTANHNLLVDDVKDSLKGQVRQRGCQVFSEAMKVDVMQGVYVMYPDVVVTCHPFDLRGDKTVVR